MQLYANPEEDTTRRWEDVAEVTVPARTHRNTVLAKAVKEMNLTVGGVLFVRVISAEDAVPIKVEMEQPPPQLRIGT